MNGINQEEVSNQSTLENYTLGYCWYPEQEYFSWCPSDLPQKTIHPDPGKFWFFVGIGNIFIRNWEFVNFDILDSILGIRETKDLFIKNRTQTVVTLVLFGFDFLWISL